MFNSPPGLSDAMDLAKMLAVLHLIAPLESDDFRIWRQTRTGLLSYPLDPDLARAHLATSVYVQMALRPHIVHVVGHTEAHHAATPEDILESCKLARRAIENALAGQPDLSRPWRDLSRPWRDIPRWDKRGLCADPEVQRRRKELVSEARVTLDAIQRLGADGVQHPLTDPVTLERAVTSGIMDAPQLKNNPYGRGTVATRIIGGACLAVDRGGRVLSEAERLGVI
jgi:hypothetical protein